MGSPSPPEQALFFAALLFKEKDFLSMARGKLSSLFGQICLESDSLPWGYSGYYTDELGSPVSRVFLFFGEVFDQEKLADVKLTTNGIERELAVDGRRTINIDPGYLTLSKIVLASTKNYSHRIYLSKGIYAEVTLVFREGRYQPHLFTYADYAGEAYGDVFIQARTLLKQKHPERFHQ